MELFKRLFGKNRPPETSETIELFHYTDKTGYSSLTTEPVDWYPSLGLPRGEVVSRKPVPGFEDDFPTDPSVFEETLSSVISVAAALAATSLSAFDVKDMHYGPGWYVTDLAPDVNTQFLLKELWQGNTEMLSKTEYWLLLSVPSYKLQIPDKRRPHVRFIPIVDKTRRSPLSLSIQSLWSVYLIEAGSRIEYSEGKVKIQQLHKPQSPTELVKPFVFGIDGFSTLSPKMRDNLYKYFGIENK